MNINPSSNTNLYLMENYFHELINLFENKKLPNKILLSGKKGIGKSTLAYHFINFVMSQDEDLSYNKKDLTINDNNTSYKLVQNKSHPNFYLIDLLEDKKNIDISQIRQMINYTNKSSFNEKPRFILIDNIENLNLSSSNALLKVMEEPNNGIFFILIHNIERKILATLKSRCLTFKISQSFDNSLKIANKILNIDLLKSINIDLISIYNSPGDFIYLINFAKEKKIDLLTCRLDDFLKILINNNYYKKNKIVKGLLINFIELFFLKEFKISKDKINFLNIYRNFLNKIYFNNKFNLDEESLFLEFKTELLNG